MCLLPYNLIRPRIPDRHFNGIHFLHPVICCGKARNRFRIAVIHTLEAFARTDRSVKGKKTAKHAVSDWMEIEKERGISVTSSVMQFNYDGYCINILDTPGHQDFSGLQGRLQSRVLFQYHQATQTYPSPHGPSY